MSGRPIAPRPARLANASSQPTNIDASASGSSQTQNSPAHIIRPIASASTCLGHRKKVTSACQGCQKRRVKCDGFLPCSACVKTGTECAYTRELDGRSIKRKYYEVSRDQDLLNDLIGTIRSSDDEHVSQIISLIRSGASIDDIKACIEQQLLDIRVTGKEKTPEFAQLQSSMDQLQAEADQRTRRPQRSVVLEIQRLADRPLHKVPAKPWTSVTDDDALVSNLISVWLTWDKGWHDWIDEDLFVRDMQAGSLDSPFCSPFLVNCLLAWACPYSDYKEARTTNGAPSQLMLDFIAEAKHLLEHEDYDYGSITATAGLLFLHASLAVSGQDRGYRYMLQAQSMVYELPASPLAAKSLKDTPEARELAGAIDRTCWGVYIINTQTLTTILKPQKQEPPRRPRPRWNSEDSTPRIWRPYPYGDEPVISYRDELFHWGCDLAIIEAELSRILFSTEDQLGRPEQEERILALYRELVWRVDRLPQRLNMELHSCPSVYTHQARIQTVVMRLFLDLRDSVPGANPDVIVMAKTKCVEAALEISRIVKTYVDSWGGANVGMMMCQPIILAVTILLEGPDTSIYFKSITNLCIALRAMSRRWPIVMAMFRMVQLEAKLKGSRLPPQTDKLFEDFEDHAWKQRELKKYVSMYPLPDTSKTANFAGEEANMGQFLEAMGDLELMDSLADTRKL